MKHRSSRTKAIGRRDFIRLVGSSAVAVSLADILAGCGGGSGSEANGTQSVSVSVDRLVIGGGSLTLRSVYGADVPVPQSGTFVAPVSSTKEQIHFLVDGNGAIRSISLSTPATRSDAPTISFDATSTALSLVFITIGIATSDASTASFRIDAIKGLTSFKVLRDYLASNLGTQSLHDLRAGTDLDTLLENCIEEYASLSRSAPRARGRDAGASGFVATWNPNASAETAQVDFTNNASRCVSVVQQNLDASDNKIQLGSPVLVVFDKLILGKRPGLLDGLAPRSPGNTFFDTYTDPGQATTPVDILNPQRIASLRLWVYGPGFNLQSTEARNSDVDAVADEARAWIYSVILYIGLPLVDLVLASTDDIAEKFKTDQQLASILFSLVQSKINWASYSDTLRNGSTAQKNAALLDLVLAVLGVIAAAFEIEPLIIIMGGFSVAFAIKNLKIVLNTWGHYAPVSSDELTISDAGVTIR